MESQVAYALLSNKLKVRFGKRLIKLDFQKIAYIIEFL